MAVEGEIEQILLSRGLEDKMDSGIQAKQKQIISKQFSYRLQYRMFVVQYLHIHSSASHL